MSPDHSAGCASIAVSLNAALDGKSLDAEAFERACAIVKVDSTIALKAMVEIGLVARKGKTLHLGPLGAALVVSAYVG